MHVQPFCSFHTANFFLVICSHVCKCFKQHLFVEWWLVMLCCVSLSKLPHFVLHKAECLFLLNKGNVAGEIFLLTALSFISLYPKTEALFFFFLSSGSLVVS